MLRNLFHWSSDLRPCRDINVLGWNREAGFGGGGGGKSGGRLRWNTWNFWSAPRHFASVGWFSNRTGTSVDDGEVCGKTKHNVRCPVFAGLLLVKPVVKFLCAVVIWHWSRSVAKSAYYNMAESALGQDEANHVFWLATRVGLMGLSCPLRISWYWTSPPFGHITNPLLTKLLWLWRWISPLFFLAFLFTLTSSLSIKMQWSMANIQLSWPCAWSIMHIILYTL